MLAYGSTREEAIARAQALALRVIAEWLEHDEEPGELLTYVPAPQRTQCRRGGPVCPPPMRRIARIGEINAGNARHCCDDWRCGWPPGPPRRGDDSLQNNSLQNNSPYPSGELLTPEDL
ncbi:hypothetical protein K2Z83_00285 [Oscillochloris sp. ZM17-4]|uniref:hypothetical protein n=1 Tax=Oscillochloris sp. ZM17-4 TaxID=2866714 RepID=UPI001C732075|nr:hypothetical protein [Oscillochloris sp. ZM17-4]MBX0326131.1 hypothetical protein [Oscillochloris sp. ZM17-4]